MIIEKQSDNKYKMFLDDDNFRRFARCTECTNVIQQTHDLMVL